MSQPRLASKTVPMLGLIITLSIAYALDRWLEMLRLNVARTFEPQVFFWTFPIVHLLLAGWVLILFWFVNYKHEPSRFIAFIYLAIGLLLPFYNALTPVLGSLATPQSVGVLSNLQVYLGPTSLLTFVSAFVAIIGLWGLVAKHRTS